MNLTRELTINIMITNPSNNTVHSWRKLCNNESRVNFHMLLTHCCISSPNVSFRYFFQSRFSRSLFNHLHLTCRKTAQKREGREEVPFPLPLPWPSLILFILPFLRHISHLKFPVSGILASIDFFSIDKRGFHHNPPPLRVLFTKPTASSSCY